MFLSSFFVFKQKKKKKNEEKNTQQHQSISLNYFIDTKRINNEVDILEKSKQNEK